MSYQVGERVGDYEVIQVLGAGGMGKVYKVRNSISDRVEAMKVLLPNLESDPDLANRFMREIKVQASLTHPNIAALHTALRVNNQLLMLMEYVEGVSLEQLVSQGALPVAKAVDYIAQALSALGYAHQHGVIHRDIKPANIMLTPGGIVKLMDFGIARATADRKLTQTGHTVGSLYYMSPEQIQGAHDLDGRADLYSVGVTLYELVTGQRPFNGNSDYSIMAAHLQSLPVPPIQIDPRLPAALNDIILMAIAKEPGQRFQSAESFRAALGTLASAGATQAHQPTAAPVYMPPPPPPPPMGQPMMPPPRAQAAAGSGSRGLYIAAGALLAIGVLAALVTQAPKFFPASKASTAPTTVAVSTIPSTTPQPTPQVPTAPEQKAAIPVPMEPTPAKPSGERDTAPSTKPVEKRQGPVQTAQVFPNNQTAPTTPTVPQTGSQVPVPQQQVQPEAPVPTAPAMDTAKLAALEKLRERAGETHIRLTSVEGSVKSLADQLRASGSNPNPILTDTLKRAAMFYTEAENSLRRGDPVKAEEYLGNAERAIFVLEGKLQR